MEQVTASRPLCIYHGNCADGFGAAWVVNKFYNGEVDLYPGVYQQPPPNVAGRDVILVDFSYKYEVMRDMLTGPNRCNSLLILDHHKTAAEELAKLYAYMAVTSGTSTMKYVFDLNRSGAGITWDYFFPNIPRPALLNHIEDRDLWRFKLPGTREIQAALFSYPYDLEIWDSLMESNPNSLFVDGVAIERKHFKDIRELTKAYKTRMVIGGVEVWACNLPYTMTSDAGHLMSEGEKTFACCYTIGPNGTYYSLRSQEDGMDVSEIAKLYGGGGHKNAAGFTLPHGASL
jgi:oligoribonuclease NrnB/cAMP/cGMP phosphodiesterase (DHH superfamily)